MADTIRAQPEPAGLSDEELLQIAAKTIEPYEDCGIGIDEYEAETECAVEAYGSELIAFARAVEAATLARAQRQPVPPEPGEVQELVKWLRANSSGVYRPAARAAELLAQRHPQPVPVSERLPDNRDPECVANWPECWSGGYDPRCCRFPKSCSCERGALPLPVEVEG